MPGFVEFHLLRGPSSGIHTLVASHTGLYAGNPQFEGFAVLQELR